MKILYAAARNNNSRIQLSRFMNVMSGTKHVIKIAAYKDYFPKNLNIDWCLDALLNIYNLELLSLNNDNLSIYFDQIKNFGPDLVISDLEYFTSYLASQMNAYTWQCSSSLINYALINEEKYNLGLFKYYAHSLNRFQNAQRTINIIDNSNVNFVYSHYGDTSHPPIIHNNFQWIRPYHKVYRLSPTCQHSIVAGLSKNNKQILNMLRKHSDSVVFMDTDAEKYQNLHVKDIGNEDEYYCNLRNCQSFVCQGQISFLADAFYNKQYSFIYPDYEDTESITNSQISSKLFLGTILQGNIKEINNNHVDIMYDNSIKYLHEKVEELG